MKFRGDGVSAGHHIIQFVVALALLAAAGGCEAPRPQLAHEAKLAEVHTVGRPRDRAKWSSAPPTPS